MRQPGDRLRAFVSRVCSDETMRRLVDPVIADLQFEHADALARGDRWRACLAVLRGATALCRIGLVTSSRYAFVGPIALSVAAVAMIFLVLPLWMAGPVSRRLSTSSLSEASRIVVYLVPQAVIPAIPIGLAIGILLGSRGRAIASHRRTTLVMLGGVAAIVTFALMAWIAPVANVAFRDLMAGRHILPGANELRINELVSAGYRWQWHLRWAVPTGVIVLAVFAIHVAAAARGRRAAIGAAIITTVAYVFLYQPFQILAFNNELPVALAPWLPNIAYATVTMLLVRLKPDTT